MDFYFMNDARFEDPNDDVPTIRTCSLSVITEDEQEEEMASKSSGLSAKLMNLRQKATDYFQRMKQDEKKLERKAFMQACFDGDMDVIKTLLSTTSSRKLLVQHRDIDGNTPLHLAASGMFHDIVLLLIRREADVHAVNYAGKTPLASFVTHATMDDKSVAELLLANEADPNVTLSNGNTVLHEAIELGYSRIAEALICAGAVIGCPSTPTFDNGRVQNFPVDAIISPRPSCKSCQISFENFGGVTCEYCENEFCHSCIPVAKTFRRSLSPNLLHTPVSPCTPPFQDKVGAVVSSDSNGTDCSSPDDTRLSDKDVANENARSSYRNVIYNKFKKHANQFPLKFYKKQDKCHVESKNICATCQKRAISKPRFSRSSVINRIMGTQSTSL